MIAMVFCFKTGSFPYLKGKAKPLTFQLHTVRNVLFKVYFKTHVSLFVRDRTHNGKFQGSQRLDNTS